MDNDEKAKYKILIVDDEEDNLSLLYRTLRRKYDVTKCLSPLEAIEKLKENEYELVISDHKMPEMNGVELLKYVYDNYPSTMRILLTAFSEVSLLIDAINYANIYRYIKKPFDPDELVMIVDGAIEYYLLKKDNESLIKDLNELFSGTIRAIVEALDAKDSFTAGRSKRVTFYSVKLAEELGLNEDALGQIEIAGLLHDIGMIGISDDLLLKVEALSPEELDEIKKHVTYSVKILDDIKHLKEIVRIIKYHHEHWNGGGYPEGISGEDIPLASRIIAIADAFDGMTSNRAYRAAKTPEEALDIIKGLSGKQFDPMLVEKFEVLFKNEDFRKYTNEHILVQAGTGESL